MKPALLLATVLAFASSTSAKLSFNGIVSDITVDVGNLDIFEAVWQQFYKSATEFGVLSHKDYHQASHAQDCIGYSSDPDLTVNVKLDGRWGNESGVGHWDVRNALVQVMWQIMQKAMADSAYDMWADCALWDPLTNPDHEGAVCGPESPNGPCNCHYNPFFNECRGKTTGHKVPSEVSIEVYDETDKLLADEYTVTITAVEQGQDSDGGCGRWGAILEVILSFGSEIGIFFEKAVKIYCRE